MSGDRDAERRRDASKRADQSEPGRATERLTNSSGGNASSSVTAAPRTRSTSAPAVREPWRSRQARLRAGIAALSDQARRSGAHSRRPRTPSGSQARAPDGHDASAAPVAAAHISVVRRPTLGPPAATCHSGSPASRDHSRTAHQRPLSASLSRSAKSSGRGRPLSSAVCTSSRKTSLNRE